MVRKIVLGMLAALVALSLSLPAATTAMAQSDTDASSVRMARALAVRAPGAAVVGQTVTIAVVERHSGSPVSEAACFAIAFEDVAAEAAERESLAELAETRGHFIGWTNEDGQVTHRFDEAGRYLLVAVKEGYLPGVARIAVYSMPALAIRAPDVAQVGQTVTIAVVERHSGRPVSEAACFAIAVEDIAAEVADRGALAELVQERGYFIGWTDDSGQVTHRFDEAGRYILVAAKYGFAPGIDRIMVRSGPVTAKRMPTEGPYRPAGPPPGWGWSAP